MNCCLVCRQPIPQPTCNVWTWAVRSIAHQSYLSKRKALHLIVKGHRDTAATGGDSQASQVYRGARFVQRLVLTHPLYYTILIRTCLSTERQ
jgi:hypothetical protein